MVCLANFYEILIDCPAAPDLFQEMLTSFESAGIIGKELGQRCLAHIETLKKQLEEEYKPDQL